MKKLLFFILIEIVFSNAVYCNLVDTTTAKTVATNFYLSRASQSKIQRIRSLASKQIELELVYQEFDDESNQNNAEPYYYVYNVKENNGFIIVSAEDNITPIIAYSFDRKYNTVIPLPPAYVDWMNKYKRLIKYIKGNKPIQTSNAKALWAKSLVKNSSENNVVNIVEPLLDKESIIWDQGCNYNLFCHEDDNSINTCMRAPAGCVAVAMGQIMRYWKYPKTSNAIPEYTSSNYGTINGVNITTYNWDNIKNTLTNTSSDIEKTAVSELLYNCGISVKMDYGSTASGAYDNDALIAFNKYFNYSNELQLIKKNNFSSEDWLDKIKSELKNDCPVYYSGNGKSSDGTTEGHAFVCDGYNSNNEFHFNWGWNGQCNGYFYHLSSLIPQDSYNVYEPYDFTDNQIAIIGIIPDKPDLIPINQRLNVTSIQAGSTITASCGEFNRSPADAGAHIISVYLSIDSILNTEKNGDIYLGEIYISGALSGTFPGPFSKSVRIPSNVAVGNYYVIFYSDGGQAIDECLEDNNYASVKLTVTAPDINNPSTKGITRLEYFIDTDPGFGNGMKLNVSTPNDIDGTFNIPLNNISEGFHILYIRAKDSENKWSITRNVPFYKLQIISSNISKLEYFIDADPGIEKGILVSLSGTNATKNIKIPLQDIPNGFHTLYIRVKDNNDNWSITSNSVFYKTNVSSPDIVKMEYFLDIDPGFDKAISVPITRNTIINKNFNIDLSNISNGFHTLFIRTKNASGKWSMASSNAFYRMQSQLKDITELEYFFDFDPGFGSGTSVPIIPSSMDITKLINIDLACLTSGSHAFYVRAKDEMGNWSLIYSKNITVTITSPIITQNGNVLHSNALTGNQWYNQNGLITGATNQDYVVTSNGDFYVIVTHSGCSSDKSNIIRLISGVEQTELNNSINIYPNPTSESFHINGFDGNASLSLTDISGKVILTKQVTSNETISVNNLPKGIYIVKIITTDGIIERKLIKK